MAKTVETTPQNIREIGLSMGLPEKVGPVAEFKTRGYVSIIRHNWHLLPYEQLLTLLDWDFKTLDFHLNEDDFLFIKLGSKQRSVWFNSMLREEPYPGLTYR